MINTYDKYNIYKLILRGYWVELIQCKRIEILLLRYYVISLNMYLSSTKLTAM